MTTLDWQVLTFMLIAVFVSSAIMVDIAIAIHEKKYHGRKT